MSECLATYWITIIDSVNNLQDIDRMVSELNADSEWRRSNMTIEQEIKMEKRKIQLEYEKKLDEANEKYNSVIVGMIKNGVSKEIIMSTAGITASEYEELAKKIKNTRPMTR